MKKSCYVSKVEDKLLIKIAKLNKDLNVMKNFKEVKVLIKDCFDVRKIHVQIILVNKKV